MNVLKYEFTNMLCDVVVDVRLRAAAMSDVALFCGMSLWRLVGLS